jgi:hypothetical protein
MEYEGPWLLENCLLFLAVPLLDIMICGYII